MKVLLLCTGLVQSYHVVDGVTACITLYIARTKISKWFSVLRRVLICIAYTAFQVSS